MQFIKNISALSALFAAVAIAAPVPAAQGLVVLDSHGQPGVPAHGAQTVTQTQTAAPSAATVTVTHTAGQPSTPTPQQKNQQPQQPWSSPASSQQPWSSTVSPQSSQVTSQPLASIGTPTQSHNTGSHSASSTSSGSKSSGTGTTGGNKSGATAGKLTIVNNCKSTIYYSTHQGLTDVSGGDQPIAPGKSGYAPISGSAQAVWITNDKANTPYAYGDRTTGQVTGNPGAAIVEWTAGAVLDLSLIKGNPFVTEGLGGQTLQTPCANTHQTGGDQYMTSCNADTWEGCNGGSYFDNVPDHDAGFSCPNMSQGLVYTACAFA